MSKVTFSSPIPEITGFKSLIRTVLSYEDSDDGVKVRVSSRAWRESQSTPRVTFWWRIEKITGYKCFDRA